MKPKVLVDMDGVLADVYSQYIALEYKDTGVKPVLEDLYGKTEEESFPSFHKYVRSKGFFETAPLLPDAVKGLKYLNDKYKVLIVYSATEFPNSLTEKQRWLNEYFPFITWEQMIFCGRKDSIQGDIMIDDHPKNLRTFGGRRILFTQPHNMCIDEASYQRVSGWEEIMNLL